MLTSDADVRTDTRIDLHVSRTVEQISSRQFFMGTGSATHWQCHHSPDLKNGFFLTLRGQAKRTTVFLTMAGSTGNFTDEVLLQIKGEVGGPSRIYICLCASLHTCRHTGCGWIGH